MAYTDKALICRDCGAAFTFTAGEQTFFASRGLMNHPSRCVSCRTARKVGGEREEQAYVHYGPFASFGGRAARQVHPATCQRCGEQTEVPFLPRGDRPVFCDECFAVLRQDGGQPRPFASH